MQPHAYATKTIFVGQVASGGSIVANKVRILGCRRSKWPTNRPEPFVTQENNKWTATSPGPKIESFSISMPCLMICSCVESTIVTLMVVSRHGAIHARSAIENIPCSRTLLMRFSNFGNLSRVNPPCSLQTSNLEWHINLDHTSCAQNHSIIGFVCLWVRQCFQIYQCWNNGNWRQKMHDKVEDKESNSFAELLRFFNFNLILDMVDWVESFVPARRLQIEPQPTNLFSWRNERNMKRFKNIFLS